jgi:hypothetical protein
VLHSLRVSLAAKKKAPTRRRGPAVEARQGHIASRTFTFWQPDSATLRSVGTSLSDIPVCRAPANPTIGWGFSLSNALVRWRRHRARRDSRSSPDEPSAPGHLPMGHFLSTSSIRSFSVTARTRSFASSVIPMFCEAASSASHPSTAGVMANRRFVPCRCGECKC